MESSVRHVLFLCTGNSARSVLAEAQLNHIGAGLGGTRFVAHSAGSHPAGKVNPFSIRFLEQIDVPSTGLRSKSWDEFAVPGAPQMDFIFTVCDQAAGEACPFWPGHPVSAHWGLPDPAAVVGSDEEKLAAFAQAAGILRYRIECFLALPLNTMTVAEIKARLAAIGKAMP